MNKLKLENLPACFTATTPVLERVTEKYKFIPTVQLIEDMIRLGYSLVATRSPRTGMGMHSMDFVHESLPNFDGLEMRISATNSHNGTSAFRFYLKVFRQVCSNGLYAWDSEQTARVVHRGYTIERVEAALKQVEAKVTSVQAQVESLKALEPSDAQLARFVSQASKLRDATPYRIHDLVKSKRLQDDGIDGWTLFNRVQESLIRGGYETEVITGSTLTAYGLVPTSMRIPGPRAKELTSVKERVTVNQALWRLAQSVLK